MQWITSIDVTVFLDAVKAALNFFDSQSVGAFIMN